MIFSSPKTQFHKLFLPLQKNVAPPGLCVPSIETAASQCSLQIMNLYTWLHNHSNCYDCLQMNKHFHEFECTGSPLLWFKCGLNISPSSPLFGNSRKHIGAIDAHLSNCYKVQLQQILNQVLWGFCSLAHDVCSGPPGHSMGSEIGNNRQPFNHLLWEALIMGGCK